MYFSPILSLFSLPSGGLGWVFYVLGRSLGRSQTDTSPLAIPLYIGILTHFGEVGEVFFELRRKLCYKQPFDPSNKLGPALGFYCFSLYIRLICAICVRIVNVFVRFHTFSPIYFANSQKIRIFAAVYIH